MASWIVSALLCAAVGADAQCTLVNFTASWCEPCKQMEPALAQLQREGWVIHTVDVDRQPELVQQYRIQNLPTLAILCGQQEVDRMVGAAPYQRIHERLLRAAARNGSGSAGSPVAGSPATGSPATGSQAPATAASHASTPRPTGPIVRGQSTSLAAFPLLAAADSLAAPNVETALPQPEASAAAPSVEQVIARAAAATVRIRVDEGNSTAYGTGTIIDVHGQDALILTCGHLFRDMQPQSQLTIDLFPGTPQEVNLPSELIDFKAEEEDIGLISFRLPTPIEPVPILARGEAVAVGQPAFSFGCDRGADPTRRDTRIKSVNRYLGADNIEIEGAPVLGRSGGGLFDLQGRLIGVCNAANPADDEGIYAAADVVYNQIERLGLSHLFSTPDAPVTSPQADIQLAAAPAANGNTHGWQVPGGLAQPQTAATPSQATPSPALASPALAQAAAPASGALTWPDQQASHDRPATQLICIVRDQAGQDQVVTIDAPPAQLLELIHQSAQR